jgi:hypothetical protein
MTRAGNIRESVFYGIFYSISTFHHWHKKERTLPKRQTCFFLKPQGLSRRKSVQVQGKNLSDLFLIWFFEPDHEEKKAIDNDATEFGLSPHEMGWVFSVFFFYYVFVLLSIDLVLDKGGGAVQFLPSIDALRATSFTYYYLFG